MTMKIQFINQSCQWEQPPPQNALEIIERAGRTCYKSESKITPGSNTSFVKMLKLTGHLSVLEHVNLSVRFITNRGVTHELVRHRLASYSQESTRYCNYSDTMQFIWPVWIRDDENAILFEVACKTSALHYDFLLKSGWRAEQAREVLNNAVKTEIVMTTNIREWMHVFDLRTSKRAHPQIRALMNDCLDMFRGSIPVLF